MAVKDMTFLQEAPLNSFVAMDGEQTRILAFAPTYQELKEKIRAGGFENVVLWKNPPAWGSFAL